MSLRLSQPAGDRAAIFLSGLCLIHCLVLPLLLALLPWLAWFVENDAVVHRWLLIAIVPVSAYALFLGCAQHGQRAWLWLGAMALAVLMGAAVADVVETWESSLTLLGSVTLSAAHLLNLRALHRHDAIESAANE